MQNNERYYAGFFVRLAAYLIDSIIMFILLFGIRLVRFGMKIGSSDNVLVKDFIFEYSLMDLTIIAITVFYFVIMTNACGATVGKMIMSIKVVSIEDRRPTFTEIIYRETVGRFLSSAIMNIGYLMIFPTKEKTALHDILSDTRVIYVHMEERYRMRPSRNVKEYGVNTSVMPPEGIFNGGMPGPNPGPQNGGNGAQMGGMPGVGGNPQMGGRPGMPGGPNGQPMNENGAQMGGRPGMPGGPNGQPMNENGAQMGGRPGMPGVGGNPQMGGMQNENLMNGRPNPMMYMPKSDFKPQRSINSTVENAEEDVTGDVENPTDYFK